MVPSNEVKISGRNDITSYVKERIPILHELLLESKPSAGISGSLLNSLIQVRNREGDYNFKNRFADYLGGLLALSASGDPKAFEIFNFFLNTTTSDRRTFNEGLATFINRMGQSGGNIYQTRPNTIPELYSQYQNKDPWVQDSSRILDARMQLLSKLKLPKVDIEEKITVLKCLKGFGFEDADTMQLLMDTLGLNTLMPDFDKFKQKANEITAKIPAVDITPTNVSVQLNQRVQRFYIPLSEPFSAPTTDSVPQPIPQLISTPVIEPNITVQETIKPITPVIPISKIEEILKYKNLVEPKAVFQGDQTQELEVKVSDYLERIGWKVERYIGGGMSGRVFLVTNDKGEKVVVKMGMNSQSEYTIAKEEKVLKNEALQNYTYEDTGHHTFVFGERSFRIGNYTALVMENLGQDTEYIMLPELAKTFRQELNPSLEKNALAYVSILAQLSDFLIVVGDNGLAHGDIKSDNLAVNPAGYLKVFDWDGAIDFSKASNSNLPKYMNDLTNTLRLIFELNGVSIGKFDSLQSDLLKEKRKKGLEILNKMKEFYTEKLGSAYEANKRIEEQGLTPRKIRELKLDKNDYLTVIKNLISDPDTALLQPLKNESGIQISLFDIYYKYTSKEPPLDKVSIKERFELLRDELKSIVRANTNAI